MGWRCRMISLSQRFVFLFVETRCTGLGSAWWQKPPRPQPQTPNLLPESNYSAWRRLAGLGTHWCQWVTGGAILFWDRAVGFQCNYNSRHNYKQSSSSPGPFINRRHANVFMRTPPRRNSVIQERCVLRDTHSLCGNVGAGGQVFQKKRSNCANKRDTFTSVFH